MSLKVITYIIIICICLNEFGNSQNSAWNIFRTKSAINWDKIQMEEDVMNSSLCSTVSNSWHLYLRYKLTFSLKYSAMIGRTDRTTSISNLWKTLFFSLMQNRNQIMLKSSNNTKHYTIKMAHHHWYFKLGTHEYIKWTVFVPSFFAINMTIWQAYVPYSQGCNYSNITSYNMGASQRLSKIWTWCGHVIKDTVYSKANKAVLKLICITNILPHPVTLNASYQIMQPGAAYVFSPKSKFLPPFWNITIWPDLFSYELGKLTFIWPLWNKVESDGVFKVLIIYIKSFRCIHWFQGTLMVYPGMLTLYQARWTDKPMTTLWCNVTEEKRIRLSFHMYATMVVNVASTDHIMTLYTIFKREIRTTSITQKLDVGKGDAVSVQTLPVMGTWKGSRLAAAYVKLQINTSNFAFAIEFTSFKSAVTKPNIHWSDVTTLSRTEIPDGKYNIILSIILCLSIANH